MLMLTVRLRECFRDWSHLPWPRPSKSRRRAARTRSFATTCLQEREVLFVHGVLPVPIWCCRVPSRSQENETPSERRERTKHGTSQCDLFGTKAPTAAAAATFRQFFMRNESSLVSLTGICKKESSDYAQTDTATAFVRTGSSGLRSRSRRRHCVCEQRMDLLHNKTPYEYFRPDPLQTSSEVHFLFLKCFVLGPKGSFDGVLELLAECFTQRAIDHECV